MCAYGYGAALDYHVKARSIGVSLSFRSKTMETNQISNNSSKHLSKTSEQSTLEGAPQMDAESEDELSKSTMVGEGGCAPQDEEMTAAKVLSNDALLDHDQPDYHAEVDADDFNHAEDGAGNEGTSSVSAEIPDNSQWPFVRKPSSPPGSSQVEQ
jgi:hypothetical protein